VTALNPILGYDKVAQITAAALEQGITPRAAALSLGLMDEATYDRVVDARTLAGRPAHPPEGFSERS
jgi:fumarate hydratase class II